MPSGGIFYITIIILGLRERLSGLEIDILSGPSRLLPKNSQSMTQRPGIQAALPGFSVPSVSYISLIYLLLWEMSIMMRERLCFGMIRALFEGVNFMPSMGAFNRGAFSPRWSVEGSPDADSLTSRQVIRRF